VKHAYKRAENNRQIPHPLKALKLCGHLGNAIDSIACHVLGEDGTQS
jgi:hypothetical protein